MPVVTGTRAATATGESLCWPCYCPSPAPPCLSGGSWEDQYLHSLSCPLAGLNRTGRQRAKEPPRAQSGVEKGLEEQVEDLQNINESSQWHCREGPFQPSSTQDSGTLASSHFAKQSVEQVSSGRCRAASLVREPQGRGRARHLVSLQKIRENQQEPGVASAQPRVGNKGSLLGSLKQNACSSQHPA